MKFYPVIVGSIFFACLYFKRAEAGATGVNSAELAKNITRDDIERYATISTIVNLSKHLITVQAILKS